MKVQTKALKIKHQPADRMKVKKKHLIFSMSQIQTPVCLCFDCLIKRYYSITLFFWTYAMVVLEVQCK